MLGDKFPQYIRNVRQRLGLTQREFAQVIGLSSQNTASVSRWENGREVPSRAARARIGELANNLFSEE